MNDLRTAAQQALEFIKVTNARSEFWLVPESNLNKTVKALKTALEQPEQEPVAWRHWLLVDGERFPQLTLVPRTDIDEPLYTTPPPCPTCEALARAVMMDQTGRD
jgi:hypothetical protein